MNLLVLSDSHGDRDAVSALLKNFGPHVEMVVHLGDVTADIARFKADFNIRMISGNCDPSGLSEEIVTVNGCRILLTHGHHHGVKMSYDRLAYYAEEKEVNACFFGHTHRPESFVRGPVYFFNPGSLGRPLPGLKPSYGLVKITDGGVITGKVMDYL